MTDHDGAAMDALREVLSKRDVKITTLAKRTGLPYRSLQNYLYKRSRMPLDVYVTICAALDITPDYIFDQKFKLKHSALESALIQAMSPIFKRLYFDDELVLRIAAAPSDDKLHSIRLASTLAVLVAQAYDLEREYASIRPFDEDE